MFFKLKKEEKSTDVFWQEYEEETGETVTARGIGKYVSGWDEFDEKNWKGLWGLVIKTSGGFRFHHFPQNSWIDALSGLSNINQPKEKTIFISQSSIISIEETTETKWWKKLISPLPPKIVVIYKDKDQCERKLVFEAEYSSKN
ncbi:MAG: hypothetical protein FWD28_05360 [Treponema sp.]|nr:hypothetical protein [Treponema sp.]